MDKVANHLNNNCNQKFYCVLMTMSKVKVLALKIWFDSKPFMILLCSETNHILT